MSTLPYMLCRLSQRQQQPAASCREPPRPAPYSLPSGPADMEGISRSVGPLMSTHSAGYSRDDVRDMPPGANTPGASERSPVRFCSVGCLALIVCFQMLSIVS